MTPKLRAFAGASLVTIPLDQGTKLWVDSTLSYADRIPVIEGFFYITHVRNPGAAFGLFTEGHPLLRLGLFVGISIVALLIVFSFYRKLTPGDSFTALSLGLILGGAVGNLLDRLRLGEVVDFLHFRLWGGYTWPDFNLADSFIVVGVGFLVLELLATEGETRADEARAGPEG